MKRFKPFSGPNYGRFRKLALPIAILIGFACGPSFDPSEFVSFFLPESANTQPDDSRYFFTPQFYNDAEIAEQYNDSIVVDENVRAWAAYAGNNLSDVLISKALYGEETSAVSALEETLKTNQCPGG